MERYWKAFYLPLQNTLERIIAFVPRFFVATLLFLLFYGLASLGRKILRRSLDKVSHVPWAVRLLIGRILYFVMIFIGLLVSLSAVNVDITTLLTSLGVAGFALGFALKDILENLISGILLLFARPFEIGDQVLLGEFEGVIENIEVRTTTVRKYNGEIIAIPNSRIYTNPVTNLTRTGRRQYKVKFDTSLTASLETVETEALRVVRDNSDILADPAPALRVTAIDSANDILSWSLAFWAAPTKAAETKTVSDTLEGIKRVLYDAGIPTPTSTSATIYRQAPSDNAGSSHDSLSEAVPDPA